MLDKLEFLIALARERHFRRAAERCGVSQPTLSAGIKQLEETLGAALVNRGARYIGLTPEGERVLEWARRLTGDARTMRQEVQVLKRGVSGVLRLAAIPTALPVAARLCDAFTQRHPEVRVTVLSSSSKAILTMLEDFEIDAGVTYLDNEPLPNATTLPLYRERCDRRPSAPVLGSADARGDRRLRPGGWRRPGPGDVDGGAEAGGLRLR